MLNVELISADIEQGARTPRPHFQPSASHDLQPQILMRTSRRNRLEAVAMVVRRSRLKAAEPRGMVARGKCAGGARRPGVTAPDDCQPRRGDGISGVRVDDPFVLAIQWRRAPVGALATGYIDSLGFASLTRLRRTVRGADASSALLAICRVTTFSRRPDQS